MPVTHASAVRKQRAFAMVGHPVDVRRARFRRAMRGGAPGEVVGSNPIGSMRKRMVCKRRPSFISVYELTFLSQFSFLSPKTDA